MYTIFTELRAQENDFSKDSASAALVVSWEGRDFESRRAESCKMNKCCPKPASLKKAVLFMQRWCGQQTLSLKNASFHVLRVAILIYKFHASCRFFIACLYSRL